MLEILDLHGPAAPRAGSNRATAVLEAGGLVLFPERRFELEADERALLDPSLLNGRAKNISLDPATGQVRGANATPQQQGALSRMISRFSQTAEQLLAELTPRYIGALQRRRTSFRPGAVAERALSRRKDDRRLHTDAFPSNPTQGRRILRVFANVDPSRPRIWELGEDGFDALAARYAASLHSEAGAAGWMMERLGLTKGRRSAYDDAMLRLHDAAKLDDAYQAAAPKRRLELPAGSMWVVYTDSVLHAALCGQHALEQTLLLPPEAMQTPELSPLRVLERQTGRRLAPSSATARG